MKRWLKYIKPYKKYFILGPLCMIVEVIGEVLMPIYMSLIVNNISADSTTDDLNAIALFFKSVAAKISSATGSNDVPYIVWLCIFMILTALTMMAGGIGGAYFGAKASINFASDIRKDTFAKIQCFSFSNIDKFSTGSLVTRLTNDVTQLQNFVNMLLRMCLRSPGMLIGALIMSVMLNARLALVLAVTIPVLALIQFFLMKVGFPRFAKMQTKIDKLNSNVQESLTNARVVKSFVRENFEKQKFAASNKDLKDAGINAMKVMMVIMPAMTLCMNITSVAVILLGGRSVIAGNMSIGNLTAFITYITQILMSLMMVSMLFVMSSRAVASGKRILEVLDEKLDLTDDNAKQKEKEVQNGKIEFCNVSFRYYKNSEEKVLDNINLTINPGKTVGIIGSTGCGKSTLVSMIPRLYDVDSGEVLIDGICVKDYSLSNLREGVGMVLQKNVLFSGTIEENLRWGDELAKDEKIYKAAEDAQAHNFVQSFSQGYQTELGQGGVNVSGGQKQRLCIARALLKKPKILILDDSTSAVDTATEAKIRNAFSKELKGSTKIIIAQRISSVIDADKIIVMDNGKITGVGTHNELLKDNTEYNEIYYSQMDKKEGVC